jgi:hypothetical protein
MPKFMLLLGGDLEERRDEESAAELYDRFASWLGELRRGDHYLTSNKLDDRAGARLRVRGGEVVEGPFMETKEAVGGAILIQAGSLDEAIALARRCPVMMVPNGFIEVRLVDESVRPPQR